MKDTVCRRSYWGYFTGVLVFCFFMCASLSNIWMTYDIHMQNAIDVLLVTRSDSTVSRSTKRPKYQLSNNLAPTKPKVIIILAYKHTGSSYTAKLIHRHPGSFYEFEPLRALQFSTHDGRPLVLLNGTHREYDKRWKNITVSDPDVAAWLVHNIATCNHRQLDVTTLINFFFNINQSANHDYVPYLKCISRGRSEILEFHANLLPQSPRDITAANKCVHMLEEACGNATIRLAKYIRLTGEALLKVVQKLDNVKVVHLVRDPRAMMDSQIRKNDRDARTQFSVFVERTHDMCSRMKQDLQLFDVMKDKLVNVLQTWRYEDLADYPMTTAKEIFKFIDMDFDPVFKKYVTDMSIKPTKNSTVRQAVWRSHIPLLHLTTVDHYCSSLYEQLGYIPLSFIEVRNLTNKDHIDLVK